MDQQAQPQSTQPGADRHVDERRSVLVIEPDLERKLVINSALDTNDLLSALDGSFKGLR